MGEENVPPTLDKFIELKYNNDKWNSLKLSYETVSEITRKKWTNTFKDNAVQTYFQFKEEGVEMSAHAISRYLPRKEGKNGVSYGFEDIVEQSRLPANYLQVDVREVKYYNNVALIYNEKKQVIVSVVNRKHPKADWREKR